GSVQYVECRVCEDGCLGGPLTVAHRFQAKETLRRLVQMFGPLPRVRPEDLAPYFQAGLFEPSPDVGPPDQPALPAREALMMRRRTDELAARLPDRYCGACGAPDCRSLAEDVVHGLAALEDCPFLK
ncbi:MAG: (Fe-S)-binding protein, partial [Thermodesulfobacteriota bacterium]